MCSDAYREHEIKGVTLSCTKVIEIFHAVFPVALFYKASGLHHRLAVLHEPVLLWECQSQMDSVNQAHQHL